MTSQSEYAAKENIVAVYLCSSRLRCVRHCDKSKRFDSLGRPSHGERGFGKLLLGSKIGDDIDNHGEMKVPAVTRETPLRVVTFQAAGVSKGLLSVEKMNENGHDVVFAGDVSFVGKKTTGEVNHLVRQDGNFMLDFWILLVDVAEKWGFWQAALAPRNSRIKGITPPKTFFLGSSIEVAHGQREQEKTVDSKEEEVEAERKDEAIAKEIRHFGWPTTEERERHCKTHVPFRPWWLVCIEALGIEDQHRHAQDGREHELMKELHRLSKTETRKPFMVTS